MCGIEVDLEPAVAEVKGAVNEVADRVLKRQGHVDRDEDGEKDDPVDQSAHATELGPLPLHDYDVPENKFVFELISLGITFLLFEFEYG